MTQPASPEASTGKIPEQLPIMPLFDSVLFPKMVFPIMIMQPDAIRLVDEAMAKDRMIGFVLSRKEPASQALSKEDLYPVGTTALILKMAKGQDNTIQLLVQGLERFTISEYLAEKPYLMARVARMQDVEKSDKETQALMSNVLGLFEQIVRFSPGLPQEMGAMAKTINEPGTLGDMVTSIINAKLDEKQDVLETADVKKRLKKVNKLLNYQLEILKLGDKIQTQVKGDLDKNQREYYLRQQLKAIQEELGESDQGKVEIDEYKEKIKTADLPEEALKEAQRELDRLARMHPSSAEYTVASTYLDWITSLPWHTSTPDNLDIKRARKILDEDHFGLDKAKRRVIEYLAVRKLNPGSKGPILCLAGPPGTGKTSLGRSIARALDRNFYRISLGGVRDEAEIRGHRRTYVGALPGRIIQGIRRSGSNNPVFMLDEIDKVGSDFRGDPSSALLEVLDPEQNFSFSDHYMDVAFDLSQVIFITTANVLDTIPPALRDRMEVLQLLGYTADEKVRIANHFLIPRQRKANGLQPGQITLTKGAIKLIISGYTREAGLRNLEREIANVCRGAATRIAMAEASAVVVKVNDVHKYLGPERMTPESKTRVSTPGVVMGLAWTPAGGELLFIEATAMKGSKGLTLTGQLGDVMKESATTALSFIRSHALDLKIDENFFENRDIHIHVPAGAIPKDGPSAGVTLLTALVSLLTAKTVIRDLAMTGEITLRGQVLPVGGIKDKVLAAHRAGIKTLILPKSNEKDLQDISKKVLKEIDFHFVDKMMDLLKLAFTEKKAVEK